MDCLGSGKVYSYCLSWWDSLGLYYLFLQKQLELFRNSFSTCVKHHLRTPASLAASQGGLYIHLFCRSPQPTLLWIELTWSLEDPFIHCMELLGKTKFSFIKAPFRLGMATGTKTQQKAWVLGSSNLRLAPIAMNIVIFIELHNCSKHPHPQNGYNGNTYYERAVLRIKWDHIWLTVSILLSKILIICPIVMWNYVWTIYKDDKGKGDLYMIIIK